MQIQPRQRIAELRLGLVLRLGHVGEKELMEGGVEQAPAFDNGQRLVMVLFVAPPRARPLLGTIRPAHITPRERGPIHRTHVLEQVGGLIAQVNAVLPGKLVVTEVVAYATRSAPRATGLGRKGARTGRGGFGGEQRSHSRPGMR